MKKIGPRVNAGQRSKGRGINNRNSFQPVDQFKQSLYHKMQISVMLCDVKFKDDKVAQEGPLLKRIRFS